MPKKFQGENSKAADARARENEKKQAVQSAKSKATEDAKWIDNDKDLERKQQRREQLELKQQEKFDKKKEAKQLLAEEEASIKSKPARVEKVTRLQIDLNRVLEIEAAAKAKPKELPIPPVVENINRVQTDFEAARDIDGAIAALTASTSQPDPHPERRAAAAYAAFEEARLPQIKAENSNMRLSQLKQLLKKEWQKSPKNPFNQIIK